MQFRLGYTPIAQFGSDAPLDPLVVSDHAEIILNTPYGNISAWNISNPVHHHYFGSRNTCSFAQTHMFTQSTNLDFMQKKIADQIESIAQRLENTEVVIQIIIEGYIDFYEKLAQRLQGQNYAILYNADFPHEETQVNTSGIIVNLNKFKLQSSFFYSQIYTESQNRTRYLGIPVAFLETIQGTALAVGAVHVPGSGDRRPLNGLNYVQELLNDVLESEVQQVVLMGDFNSIPKLVGDNIKGAQIKLSPYPTHVNPGRQVSYYDMALVAGLPSVQMLPLEYTSSYTQALLESIYNCREYYLHSEQV